MCLRNIYINGLVHSFVSELHRLGFILSLPFYPSLETRLRVSLMVQNMQDDQRSGRDPILMFKVLLSMD